MPSSYPMNSFIENHSSLFECEFPCSILQDRLCGLFRRERQNVLKHNLHFDDDKLLIGREPIPILERLASVRIRKMIKISEDIRRQTRAIIMVLTNSVVNLLLRVLCFHRASPTVFFPTTHCWRF
jgi:hypothetical protein